MPAVAVVVRTKDRPLFLRRALQSIAGQTFADWECVIVNDGGDRAPVEELVAGLETQHRDRVRIIHHDAPRGRWVSANAGVLATSAPLLVLHDDDDSWHREFLERAHGYLTEHAEADGVVSRIEIVWETVSGEGFDVVGREVFQSHLHDVTLSDTLLFNRFVPIGFLYRRSLHEELGLYDDELPVVGDWSFYLRVLSRGPLSYLDDAPLVHWHQRAGEGGVHGNSVTGESAAHARYDALIRDEALRAHVAEHGLGLVLYLTKFIDRRFVEVENGIRGELVAQHDRTRHETQGLVTGLLRRAKRRWRGTP